MEPQDSHITHLYKELEPIVIKIDAPQKNDM